VTNSVNVWFKMMIKKSNTNSISSILLILHSIVLLLYVDESLFSLLFYNNFTGRIVRMSNEVIIVQIYRIINKQQDFLDYYSQNSLSRRSDNKLNFYIGLRKFFKIIIKIGYVRQTDVLLVFDIHCVYLRMIFSLSSK
jgi:hypothetical protein